MSQLKQKRKGIEKRTAMWHAEFELANNHRDREAGFKKWAKTLCWRGMAFSCKTHVTSMPLIGNSVPNMNTVKKLKSRLFLSRPAKGRGGLFIAFYLAKQKAMLKG